MQIHKYAGKTSLNYLPFGASVETIPDLQTVCSDTDDCEDTKLCNPTTSGVHELQSIFSCIHCKKQSTMQSIEDNTIVNIVIYSPEKKNPKLICRHKNL